MSLTGVPSCFSGAKVLGGKYHYSEDPRVAFPASSLLLCQELLQFVAEVQGGKEEGNTEWWGLCQAPVCLSVLTGPESSVAVGSP